MASLTSIPLELLVLISYDLATKDLGSLRCTCKQIEKSLFDYFTQEFFSKRQFMFTQPSLQSLVDISNHGVLSKQLKHVILSMDRYCEATRDFGDSDAAEKYMQGYADQKTLLDNGLARELLTEAFQKLPSLETIGIRDYNNRGRIRDDGAEWRSYGAPTVHAETGFQLTSNPSLDHYNRETVPKLFASRIFSTTYYALGKAGRSPPEFEILLRKPNGGLCDQAFNIPDFTLPVIGPVLRGTKSLLLSLNLQETHPPLLIDHDNIVCSGRLLRKFLGYTSNLTHLRLNFQKLHIRENDDFLRWLGEPIATGPYSYAPYLPVPVALPCLQRLDIGMLQTNTQTLLSPLVKFAPSLKKVSIWKVTLSPPIHPNLNRDPSSNFWLRFFDTLSKLPNFQPDYLLFGLLGHDYFHVKFKVAIPDEDDEALPNADGDEEEEVERTHKMEFTGRTGMNEFLKSLVRRVEVQYPKPQVIRGPSTVDDEEEVEEESD